MAKPHQFETLLLPRKSKQIVARYSQLANHILHNTNYAKFDGSTATSPNVTIAKNCRLFRRLFLNTDLRPVLTIC